jgi:hypothetical protein
LKFNRKWSLVNARWRIRQRLPLRAFSPTKNALFGASYLGGPLTPPLPNFIAYVGVPTSFAAPSKSEIAVPSTLTPHYTGCLLRGSSTHAHMRASLLGFRPRNNAVPHLIRIPASRSSPSWNTWHVLSTAWASTSLSARLSRCGDPHQLHRCPFGVRSDALEIEAKVLVGLR